MKGEAGVWQRTGRIDVCREVLVPCDLLMGLTFSAPKWLSESTDTCYFFQCQGTRWTCGYLGTEALYARQKYYEHPNAKMEVPQEACKARCSIMTEQHGMVVSQPHSLLSRGRRNTQPSCLYIFKS